MAMWSMTGYKKWNMRFGYLRRGSATIVVKLVVMEGCVVCGFDAEDKSQSGPFDPSFLFWPHGETCLTQAKAVSPTVHSERGDARPMRLPSANDKA
ncbi:alcohol dehydrogenase [Aspergillus luchuensis]|uniref:Alcohol dehydrogenase n=1 Tax=Aspergillus kawachii TaxID=1069201 RepID=A0A146FKQ6_ASPKA|nr:alcohol dehydrogenase [Aspergillus luchuensis]